MLKYVFNGRNVRYGLWRGLAYDSRCWSRKFWASDNSRRLFQEVRRCN
jgi:hypothetical protein